MSAINLPYYSHLSQVQLTLILQSLKAGHKATCAVEYEVYFNLKKMVGSYGTLQAISAFTDTSQTASNQQTTAEFIGKQTRLREIQRANNDTLKVLKALHDEIQDRKIRGA